MKQSEEVFNQMAKLIAEKVTEATEKLWRYPNTDELEYLITELLKRHLSF